MWADFRGAPLYIQTIATDRPCSDDHHVHMSPQSVLYGAVAATRKRRPGWKRRPQRQEADAAAAGRIHLTATCRAQAKKSASQKRAVPPAATASCNRNGTTLPRSVALVRPALVAQLLACAGSCTPPPRANSAGHCFGGRRRGPPPMAGRANSAGHTTLDRGRSPLERCRIFWARAGGLSSREGPQEVDEEENGLEVQSPENVGGFWVTDLRFGQAHRCNRGCSLGRNWRGPGRIRPTGMAGGPDPLGTTGAVSKAPIALLLAELCGARSGQILGRACLRTSGASSRPRCSTPYLSHVESTPRGK